MVPKEFQKNKNKKYPYSWPLPKTLIFSRTCDKNCALICVIVLLKLNSSWIKNELVCWITLELLHSQIKPKQFWIRLIVSFHLSYRTLKSKKKNFHHKSNFRRKCNFAKWLWTSSKYFSISKIFCRRLIYVKIHHISFVPERISTK